MRIKERLSSFQNCFLAC